MGRRNSNGKRRKIHINKPHLIPEWKQSWRFWSQRLTAIGILVTSILIAWPEAALQAWMILPDDLKQRIPERYVPLIGMAIFALSMLARVIQQTKLQLVTEQQKNGQSETVVDSTDH